MRDLIEISSVMCDWNPSFATLALDSLNIVEKETCISCIILDFVSSWRLFNDARFAFGE